MTDNPEIQKVKTMANELNINVDFIFHAKSGKTTDDAEKALGISSDSIIKTLILYDSKKDSFVGAIILGIHKLDIKSLTKLSESKKLSFASDEQIYKLTGFKIGGVPPFAVQYCNKFFVDANVAMKDYVVGAGGSEFCGLRFSPKDLISKLEINTSHVVLQL